MLTQLRCRVKEKCPLAEECLTKNVIYQAVVTTPQGKEFNVGLTATEFKTRYRNHLSSFKDPKKKNATELSKHIWRLKENNIEFTITWEIVARAKPYSNSKKKLQSLHHWEVLHPVRAASQFPKQKKRVNKHMPARQCIPVKTRIKPSL